MNNSLTQAKRALRLFSSDTGTKSQRHHNARSWLRSVSILGSRWLLANKIAKKA